WFIDTNCDDLPDIVVSASGSPGSPSIQVTDGSGNPISGTTGTGKYAGSDLEAQVTGLTLPAIFRLSGFIGSRVDGLGEDALAPITCPPPSLQIGVDKAAGRSSICPGDTTHFFITVRNTGSGDLTVNLTDQLPSGLTYDGDFQSSCGIPEPSPGSQLIFAPFPLAIGAFCTVSFRVRAAEECLGDQVNMVTSI